MKTDGSMIPEEFWSTETGRNLCTAMHANAWDGLDCLNAEIDALSAAIDATPDSLTKSEIARAKAMVVAAREASRMAMAILKDTAF